MTKKIIGSLEIFVGFFFLASMSSDIQLGFGLVLIAMGVNQLTK